MGRSHRWYQLWVFCWRSFHSIGEKVVARMSSAPEE